jgi:hypothetical protein
VEYSGKRNGYKEDLSWLNNAVFHHEERKSTKDFLIIRLFVLFLSSW